MAEESRQLMFHYKKKFYSRGFIDLPSVLIALAWFGLWLVWPLAEQSAKGRTHGLGGPRVAYVRFAAGEGNLYMEPDLFGRPSRIGFRLPEQREDVPVTVPDHRTSLPRFLEWPSTLPAESTSADHELLSDRASRQMGSYRPYRREEHVFSQKAGRDMRTLAEVSGELKKYGFLAPVFRVESVKQSDKPWLVVVYVEVSEDGRPEHVFLETKCDDQEINDMIVKAMYKGRLLRPGKRCEGRVTVSFGTQ